MWKSSVVIGLSTQCDVSNNFFCPCSDTEILILRATLYQLLSYLKPMVRRPRTTVSLQKEVLTIHLPYRCTTADSLVLNVY